MRTKLDMKKILVITPEKDCGSALVRVDPFYYLKENGHIEHVTVALDVSWEDILAHDIVYIHRGYLNHHLAIALQAKRQGKKIWVDVDDDLLDIPVDNTTYFTFQDPVVRQNIHKIMALADVMTVSSKVIFEKYKQYCPNTVYIPCVYSERILSMRKGPSKKRNKIISWRGSPSHIKSLMEFGPAIIEVQHKHPDWSWSFVGQYPWWFVEKFKDARVHVQAFMTPMRYFDYMRDLQPAIQMLVLTDNPFTRSRSNSAWLDGTMAGAVTLAPNWEHWRQPGIMNYADVEDFKLKLDEMMTRFDGGFDYENSVNLSWKEINKRWTLTLANEKRIEILKELTQKRKLVS